ncbi:fimbrial biogenesis chaperone [Sinorhizobium arboris]|uniref:fimbrial biogenesis chaperone n=1 Tax=Sinorhizobium arboris TaxID=76745 RepID=UPI00040C0C26|nr:molecular chaperone [Sinorhizobium arboris]
MRLLATVVAGLAIFSQWIAGAEAASLRVAPVILDLKAPTAASTMRIWNEARTPINVQIRVFRWRQVNGENTYEATNEVVASPPITALRPGGENLVRIVRTSKRPVEAEESYRLVVDELPDPSRRTASAVVMVVRHSIPVFFGNPEAANAAPSWAVQKARGGYVVTVRNRGSQRIRISDLALSSGSTVLARGGGLVGYVLGNSTAKWFVPGTGRGRGAGSVTISADSEAGRLDATARLSGG